MSRGERALERSELAVEADVRAELESHLALAADAAAAEGLDADAAQRRALARFGDPERILRRCMKEKVGGVRMLQRFNLALTALLLIVALVFGARSYELLSEVATLAGTLEQRVRALESEPPAPAVPEEVVVRIGDRIELRDDFHPEELNCVEEVARDGTVLLPEMGHVPVAGLTRAEVEGLLRGKYAAYYDQLSLWVKVREAGVTQLESPAIRVGDVLEIRDRHREHDFHERQRVQPDGTVLLIDLGRVQVAGSTREELEARLNAAYAPYYEGPGQKPLVVDVVIEPGS